MAIQLLEQGLPANGMNSVVCLQTGEGATRMCPPQILCRGFQFFYTEQWEELALKVYPPQAGSIHPAFVLPRLFIMVVEVGGHCPHTPPTPSFQIHTILFPPAPHFGDSSPRHLLIPLPTHLGGRISPGDCSNNTQPSPHRQPLWWERFIPVNHQLLE